MSNVPVVMMLHAVCDEVDVLLQGFLNNMVMLDDISAPQYEEMRQMLDWIDFANEQELQGSEFQMDAITAISELSDRLLELEQTRGTCILAASDKLRASRDAMLRMEVEVQNFKGFQQYEPQFRNAIVYIEKADAVVQAREQKMENAKHFLMKNALVSLAALEQN